MFDSATSCSIVDENSFGPRVNATCLDGFDFTLLFEEYILTILPLGLVLAVIPLRVIYLWRLPKKVRKSWLYMSKMFAFFCFISIQVAHLAVLISSNAPKTNASIATVSLVLAGFCLLAYLSHLEHLHSLCPSTTLNLYLGASLVLEVPHIRTLWLVVANRQITALETSSFVLRSIILILEVTEKRWLLKDPYKNSAPEDTSGIYSRSLFFWLNGLLWEGARNTLSFDTLPVLDEELLSASYTKNLAETWTRAEKTSPDSLFKVLALYYKWSILVGVIPRLAYTGFKFAQPFLVSRVLQFMHETSAVSDTAHGLIAAYAFVYTGIAFSFATYEHQSYRFITMLRGSLINLIFEKTMRLDSTVADTDSLTLINSDIERVGSGLHDIHEFYSSFIELGLSFFLLERLLGVAVTASALFLLICICAGIPVAIAGGNAQHPWLKAIERRIVITSKFLYNIKGIKMAGLAHSASDVLTQLRIDEVKASLRFRLYGVLILTIIYSATVLTPFFGFGLYSFLARAHKMTTLKNDVAFAALTLFTLQYSPVMSMTYRFEKLIAAINSFRRIQKYLLNDERSDLRVLYALSRNPAIQKEDKSIEISNALENRQEILTSDTPCATFNNVCVSWPKNETAVLKNLNASIAANDITMVIGPVGCGKSTLLKLLLGEVSHVSGEISTTFENAAHCSQDPWLTYDTLRNNILGGSTWDASWYNKIIDVCSLQLDLQLLPHGDQSNIGPHGSRLSGGQRVRVSLARALYSKQPVLILDDVLKGLDAVTENAILESVLSSNGIVRKYKRTVIMATNSVYHLSYADSIIVLNHDGQLVKHGSFGQLVACGYLDKLSSIPQGSDAIKPSRAILDSATIQKLPLNREHVQEASHKSGDFSTYLYYFQNAGWYLLVLYMLSCAVMCFGFFFPQIWLQWWTSANEENPNQPVGYWLAVYAALGTTVLLSSFAAGWIFSIKIVPRTANNFHNILLDTTLRTSISSLVSTDVGEIINRFSQDLDLIDAELPDAYELTVIEFLTCVCQGVLICVSSSYVAAAIPGFILVMYFIQKYYLRTSRQIRYLDIEAKAPLFSHFIDTLSGLVSVRAYGWTEEYNRHNIDLLNSSQRPYYLQWCIQRWLNLVLDLLLACIAILLVAIATRLEVDSPSNFLSVSLYNVVGFSASLKELIFSWTGLETAIGAVLRIKIYSHQTETENSDSEVDIVAHDWPQYGCLDFKNLTASYNSIEPSLKNIDFRIQSGQKIAICGRTGSGKSSLILAILKMLEPSHGAIHIDGIDISRVSRTLIRNRLNTIPQDTSFLNGSIRFNIDPYCYAKDEEIVDSLKCVQMWSYIESKGGLEVNITDELLSHGQRQLICLARALCKPSSIVIIDEPTSCIDPTTDMTVQKVIRDKFKSQTLIMVTHDLHTIIDYDRVCVLDQGEMVEFDSPRALLARDKSAFKALFQCSSSDGGNETSSENVT